MMQNERRKFFRLKLNKPICCSMSIIEVDGEPVSTGNSKICIINIGPGGLAFISPLDLPVKNKSVIYQFKTIICDEMTFFIGHIVRKSNYENNMYLYGVCFNHDEANCLQTIKLMNRLAFLLSKNCTYSTSICNNACKVEELKNNAK